MKMGKPIIERLFEKKNRNKMTAAEKKEQERKQKKEEKKQKETSGTPSQAAKTYTVSFTVPGSGSAKQVKIVASDATSSRVLYSGSAAPGTRLRETVTLGQDASVQFYVNGALVEDRSL